MRFFFHMTCCKGKPFVTSEFGVCSAFFAVPLYLLWYKSVRSDTVLKTTLQNPVFNLLEALRFSSLLDGFLCLLTIPLVCVMFTLLSLFVSMQTLTPVPKNSVCSRYLNSRTSKGTRNILFYISVLIQGLFCSTLYKKYSPRTLHVPIM